MVSMIGYKNSSCSIMLSNKRIVLFCLFTLLLFSSCEKEEILPKQKANVISIDKYLSKDTISPRKEKVRIKRKRNKFKIRLIRKQRAL